MRERKILFWNPDMRGVMAMEKYMNMLARVQRRLALRIISVHRTVSREAAEVIADLAPIDLQVKERAAATTHRRGRTR